ncbi:hypothetical protein CIW82_07155 [Acetobacter tropicalis]|uniref:Uncharacterized protein n=1 Tax=Acetobacter tropicalis TaxID=104102 RepID=A0A291PGC8_9PROT|nr:hypothetical protein CIW82_07155 [Acetobacter tropicalis]
MPTPHAGVNQKAGGAALRSGGGTIHSLQAPTETQAFTEITEKIRLKARLALVRSRDYASKRAPIMKQAPMRKSSRRQVPFSRQEGLMVENGHTARLLWPHVHRACCARARADTLRTDMAATVTRMAGARHHVDVGVRV